MGEYFRKIIVNDTTKITILFFGLLVSYAYAAQDPSAILLGIEERMSGVKTIEADFIQEKRLAAFSRPVTLKGKIFIQKPNLFSWQARYPVRYSMLIKDDVIKQWDEESDQIQQFSLAHNPNFSIAIAQMRVWFSGAYLSLLKDYDAKIISTEPVILEFTPLPANPARSLLRNVRVSFSKDKLYLREITIEEKNGDSSTITFLAVTLNMPINPSAWELKTHAQ